MFTLSVGRYYDFVNLFPRVRKVTVYLKFNVDLNSQSKSDEWGHGIPCLKAENI